MSIKLMAAAWELDIPSTEKMVLLCLCDFAGDGGQCWPSVPTIARKCSKGDRTIQAAIQWLRDEGYCSWDETPGKPHKFALKHHKIYSGTSTEHRHYVYRTEDADSGEFYIGARSCQGGIDEDAYLGSGNWVTQARKSGHALRKTILEIVGSREELAQAELRHVKPVFGTAGCMNEKIPTPGTLSPLHATPADSAPRNSRTPQLLQQTPARFADEPLREPSSSSEAKASSPRAWALPVGVHLQVWQDFKRNRERKRLPNTETAWKAFNDDLRRVSLQTGIPPPQLIERCTAKGWASINDPDERKQSHERPSNPTALAVQRVSGLGAG